MRIISGTLGGRNFNAPKGHHTHPMSDKIRGALFNVLGDINGLSLLDAFAGSGGISYEAASRGAGRVLAIENDKQAARTISENIEALNLQAKVELKKGNAVGWSNRNRLTLFDIVVLDPPFDEVLYTNLIKLTRHAKPGGLVVLSLPSDEDKFRLPGFNEVARKFYGDAQLVFYRKIE